MRRFHSGKSRQSNEPVDLAGLSDADILAASLLDPKAFAVLFDRYWDPIFRVCYFRMDDWHGAEDSLPVAVKKDRKRHGIVQRCGEDLGIRQTSQIDRFIRLS